MNKLKTSTKVLIALAAAAIVLGAVLFFTMPEALSEQIGEHHALMMSGENIQAYRGHGFKSFGHRGFHPGGFLILFIIAIFIFRKRRFHHRGHHGKAILDELYAEEKITEEEYRRRRTVIEEDK